jgi:peptidyl-prolyl cis-trans isomerase B (cyclophilin B)
MKTTLIGLSCFACLFSGIANAQQSKPTAPKLLEDIHATLKTSRGSIKIALYAAKTPVTVANFLNLAKRGYYNGVTFHRVVEDFVIQGGDPTGTGKGGPGYFIENEVVAELKHDAIGVLSMARKSEPDTNGSQFFITLDATPHLDGGYSVFGKVVSGIDVVEKIRAGDTIESIEVHDSTDPLFTKMEKRLDEWNRILDERAKNPGTAAEKP